MNEKLYRRVQRAQEEYESYFQQKADILSLKTKPNEKVKWPIKTYRQVYQNSHITKKLKERSIYTTACTKSIANVHVTRQRYFRRLAWDPRSTSNIDLKTPAMDKSVVDASIENDLISFIESSMPCAANSKDDDTTVNDQETGLIKDLSLQLLDQILSNIANPLEKDSGQTKKDLDWEFMLANALQVGLPTDVINRVKSHMALVTGKNTPAITAMNVTPCQLSDLTIPDTEVEMKNVVRQLYEQTEKDSFEPASDDEFHQDVQWLMDLSQRDYSNQLAEIEKIESNYSNHVLNLDSASS